MRLSSLLARSRYFLALLLVTGVAPLHAQNACDPQASHHHFVTCFFSDDPRDIAINSFDPVDAHTLPLADELNAAAPFAIVVQPPRVSGVDWKHLLAGSMSFLAVEHAFRLATEPSTRLHHYQPLFHGYADSVANLHGWGDGDAFLINYVGHPMQGAVSGFIWQHNDRAYRNVEFGRNRNYWRAKMRGAAFAYVYSVQFEIGPISEASIGHVQSWWPQVGFVDHVITPTVGLGWTLAEDSIDRMVIQRFEPHLENPWLRMFLRGGLNPSRSFANVMMGQVPWHRDDRPGIFKPISERAAAWNALAAKRPAGPREDEPTPVVAPFEFTFASSLRSYLDGEHSKGCIGGGGQAGFRVNPQWQILLDVGGCKVLGFSEKWSGDSLSYLVGPRWTPQAPGKWVPHAEALLGGLKVTQEYLDPALKAAVADWPTDNDTERYLKHKAYTKDWDANGFAFQMGAGVDYRVNSALQVRVANLEYTHAWIAPINGMNYHNSVAFTGGLVLRMGTW